MKFHHNLEKLIPNWVTKGGSGGHFFPEIWQYFTPQGTWLIFYPETKYWCTIAKISKLNKIPMTMACWDYAHGSNKGKLGLLVSLQNLRTTSEGEVKFQVNVEVGKTLLKITSLHRAKYNFRKSKTLPQFFTFCNET